jgi:hypothetical protein
VTMHYMAGSEDGAFLAAPVDRDLVAVASALRNPRIGFRDHLELVIRESIDGVLNIAFTQRWDIHGTEVAPPEKTFVGTQVEIRLADSMGWKSGARLDVVIDGREVDVKFSLSMGGWMIGPQQVGDLLLLVTADDRAHTFSAGLVRATMSMLNKPNQDKKRSLSAAARATVEWIVQPGTPLRPSFFAVLDPEARGKVLSRRLPVTDRLEALMLASIGNVVPRYAVEVAARQRDPMRRLREDLSNPRCLAARLGQQGIVLIVGGGRNAREDAERLGFQAPDNGDVLVVRSPGAGGAGASP